MAANEFVYDVEEFVRNQGNCGNKRIVFIGASYKFVHKVLRDMMIVGGFEDCELMVHDLDDVPMNMVADLLEKMARQQKTNMKVFRSADRKQALQGADAVVLCITTGGNESDYRSYEVCQKYGISTGVGDTMGPAAFARNMRMIPVVLDIIRDMEDICPNAVMLNFTNPMSALTAAMARRKSIPCWGLCHSADELYSYFSKVFHCKKTDITMDIGGVNHQSFVTRLLIKGADKTAEMLEATRLSTAKMEDNLIDTRVEDVDLQQEICAILG
ncbi:MAG: hypothetical protein HRU15_20915, partial [Planctomycetes bacterium]|nr:hypothetical protein [Planctomycetota bacterium]